MKRLLKALKMDNPECIIDFEYIDDSEFYVAVWRKRTGKAVLYDQEGHSIEFGEGLYGIYEAEEWIDMAFSSDD